MSDHDVMVWEWIVDTSRQHGRENGAVTGTDGSAAIIHRADNITTVSDAISDYQDAITGYSDAITDYSGAITDYSDAITKLL